MKISVINPDVYNIPLKTAQNAVSPSLVETPPFSSFIPISAFGILPQKSCSPISFSGDDKKTLLNRYDVDKKRSGELLKLNPKQSERVFSLLKSGCVPETQLISFSLLTDKHYDKAVSLAQRNINASHILDLAFDDKIDKYYDKYIELSDNGFDGEIIPEIRDFTPDKLERVAYITNVLMSDASFDPNDAYYIAKCADSDDKRFKKIQNMLEINMRNIQSVYLLSSEHSRVYKNALDLFSDGFEEDGLIEIASLKGNKLSKAKHLVKNFGVENYTASECSSLDEKEYSRVCELKARGIENLGVGYISVVDLPDESYYRLCSLLDEGCDYEEKFSKCFDKDELNAALYAVSSQCEKNSRRWNDFIENSSNSELYQASLSNKDVFFLKQNAFGSPFYTPEEYTEAFIYLKNIRTPGGKRILNCEEFYEKTPGFERTEAKKPKDDKLLYENIKEILSINPSSVEASYIQTLLELIRDGNVNASAIRHLGYKDNYNNKSFWCISDNMKSDIDMLYGAIAENRDKTKLQSELADKYVPTFKTENDAIKSLKTGDAFLIDGERFIRLKTPGDKSEQMKISKETYTKLFPPVDRFAQSQQILGDCFCLETLLSLYGDIDTRADIVRLFSEDDDNNITVKFEGYKPCLFNNGKLDSSEEIFSNGADGFKLLEYSYSQTLVEDEIASAKKKLSKEESAVFDNFMAKYPDNFFIYEKKGKPSITTYIKALETGLYKRAKFPCDVRRFAFAAYNEFLLGNGGNPYDVLKKTGFKPELYYKTTPFIFEETPRAKSETGFLYVGADKNRLYPRKDFAPMLMQQDFFKKNNVQAGISSHAYSIEQDEKNPKRFYIYNPHNQGFPGITDDLQGFLSETNIDFLVVTPKNT